MAYEALNNAGHLHAPLIVVLNDNEMSISPNVGALNEYLDALRTDDTLQPGQGERRETAAAPAAGRSCWSSWASG